MLSATWVWIASLFAGALDRGPLGQHVGDRSISGVLGEPGLVEPSVEQTQMHGGALGGR